MKLSPRELDALQELVNIGIGQAAGILNDMIRSEEHTSELQSQ